MKLKKLSTKNKLEIRRKSAFVPLDNLSVQRMANSIDQLMASVCLRSVFSPEKGVFNMKDAREAFFK